ncbi:RNA ligase-domain-containing protein [Mycena galopus ATCC 62051]|nr:RNA ligase-domain-containing protein [Mycena galopus ATCC 62051]
MAHPAVTEDSALIQQLMDLSSTNPSLVRADNYAAPADPKVSITSWKMPMHNEEYHVVPSPFPNLARGIFSLKQPDDQYRIVVRGYDKFFKVGEVPWTTWEALEADTTAPYILSPKRTGSIILIAALTPEKLLITSQHSVGSLSEKKPKFGKADDGEEWLRRYLARQGRTEAELAGVLWEKNWTAVAELCSKNPTNPRNPNNHNLPKMTGLHLHGLNASTKAFTTQPQAVVDAFAVEWGFLSVPSIELPSVADVRTFTDKVGKLRRWNGVPVQAFVVRTHVAGTRNDPPYPPGSPFFFQVEFTDTGAHREWGEVTKALLGMRRKETPTDDQDQPEDGMSIDALPERLMRRPETRAYAAWVIEQIRRDPTAFVKDYKRSKEFFPTRFLLAEGNKAQQSDRTGDVEKDS